MTLITPEKTRRKGVGEEESEVKPLFLPFPIPLPSPFLTILINKKLTGLERNHQSLGPTVTKLGLL